MVRPDGTAPTDLYDGHYERVETDIYRDIRAETFDEDLGQTGWLTAAACDAFCRRLDLGAGSRVLEIACGSGGVSVRMADRFGASVVGVDLHEAAIGAAAEGARRHGLGDRVCFLNASADEPLPFDDGSFDVVFCNDAINHFADRPAVLSEWHRVLAPGGRCLYTDPIVVTGCLSNAEIAMRSSIAFFLFTPVGANEAFLEAAGFRLEQTEDVTDAVADVSRRWHDARARREVELIAIEGRDEFWALQAFLAMVDTLSSEGRLSRYAFTAHR